MTSDIRTSVPCRKVSGSTRSDQGRDCRAPFLGQMTTGANQSIRFWDDLGSRVAGPGAPDVVTLPSRIARAGPPYFQVLTNCRRQNAPFTRDT